MSFLTPAWWWLAPPLLAWIAWLHTRRRRRLVVASLAGWERGGGVPAAPRLRLRPAPSWPLTLQLLAALLALAALAGVRFGSGEPGVERVVFVVGADDARAGAEALAPGGAAYAGASARVTVLDARAGGRPLVADVAADAAAAALQAAWTADERPADWAAAAAAVARLGGSATRQVVVLAPPDAAATSVAAFAAASAGGPPPVVVAAGEAGAPVAVERAVVRDDARGGRLEVDVRVRVAGAPSLAIEARRGSQTVGRASVASPVPGRIVRTLPLAASEGAGDLEVVVRVPADGPVVATVWRTDPTATAAPVVRVAVVGEPGPRLRAFLSAAGADVAVHPTAPTAPLDADLTIVVGVALDAAPEGHAVWLGVAPPGVAAEVVPGPWVVRFGAHETLLPVAVAHALEVPELLVLPRLPGAAVLAWAEAVPAVQARVVDGRAEVVAGLPAAGAWVDDDALYVLLGRLLRWLEPGSGPTAAACRVGAPCALPVRPAVGAWTVRAPSGAGAVPGPAWTQGVGAVAFAPWFVPVEAGWHAASAGDDVRRVWVDPDPGPIGAVGAGATGTAVAPAAGAPFPVVRTLAVAALLLALGGAWGPGARARWRAWRPVRRAAALALLATVAAAAAFALVGGPWPTGWAVPRTVVLGAVVPEGAAWSDAFATWSDDLAVAGERVDVPVADPEAPLREGGGTGDAGAAADGPAVADLERALGWAAAWLADAPVGRVVVPTQGFAADAAVARALEALSRRADLAFVQLPRFASAEEVVVHGASVLGDAGAGGTARVVLDVEPATDRALRLSVARDGEPWFETDLDLVAGRSTLSFDAPVAADAATRYDLVLVDAAAGVPVAGTAPVRVGGTAPAWAGAVVPAAPRPKLAVVTDEVAWPLLFVQLLEVQGFEATLLDPSAAPTDPAGWAAFDVVALFDLPAIALLTAQQTALEAWVAEYGGGLVLLGGPRAFGPGGYHLTELDALSPLTAAVPMDRPDVAVVFVLDRSGSMLQPVGPSNRLEIAREATWEAIQLLDPRSQVGIIVFDSSSTVIHPVRPVADLGDVRRSLDLLRAGGGTNLLPALEHAHAALAGLEDMQRHVVVMTDGLTMGADFDPVMDAFVADGITVSTIAVGRGAAYPRLELIARLTGGVFHESIDFELLPSIMAQEVLLLTTDVVRREPSAVVFEDGAEFLAGVGRAWPEVAGAVRTTARPEAVVHASLEDGTPLLASWRYGAGRVAAWSSEAVGPWTFDWIGAPGFPQLWGQLLRWVGAHASGTGLQPIAYTDGPDVVVEVRAADERGAPVTGAVLEVRWSGPARDGSPREVGVVAREVGVGTYVARAAGFAGPVDVVVSGRLGAVEAAASATTVVYAPATPAPPGDPGQVRALAAALGATYGDVRDLELGSVARVWRGTPVVDPRPWLALLLLAWAAALGLRYR